MTWPLRNKPAVSHTSLPRLPSRAIIHFWLSFFPPPPFPRASVTASGRFPASGYAQAWSGRRVCSWQQQREETYIFVRYLYVTVLCHYRNEEETENPTGVGLLLLLLLTTTTPTTTTVTLVLRNFREQLRALYNSNALSISKRYNLQCPFKKKITLIHSTTCNSMWQYEHLSNYLFF